MENIYKLTNKNGQSSILYGKEEDIERLADERRADIEKIS